jgi:gliding motility-associatede transport system auxiliary component
MNARIWTVARREIRALLDHPTGYVLLVVFVTINAFLFFRQAYLIGAASLRPMLDLLPWVLLFIVPAVTMRTLAEDRKSGVLEVVLTQPITELELVLGKYVGAVVFLWIALALTLVIPIGLSLGSSLQWGTMIAQYVGAALLIAGMAGIGVWASSLTDSQITAYILAVAVMFIALLIGLEPVTGALPPALGAIAARLGVLSHFDSIGRGVIDLRDAIYFVSLAGIFLALAYGSVVGRKLAHGGAASRQLRLGVSLITATLVVVNLLGSYIGGRLDLTPGHAYTLSPATKHIVGSLDDIVTIKVFASDELPTSAALLKRDLDDLLRDLHSAGHGKIRIVRLNPSKDETAKRDAASLGIEPVQFNVIGQSELQVKEGYLGLAVQYGTGSQAIPFVGRTDDLEYRLVSDIRTLTQAKKPVVGLVADARDQSMRSDQLRAELAKSYDVRTVSLSDTGQPAKDLSALVLVGPAESLSTAATQRLLAYFHRGGSALILASSMTLSPQMPMAMPRPVGWNDVLKPFGVSVSSNMVYDLAANEVVPVRASGGLQVLERYPLFIRAKSTGESVVNEGVNDVLLAWASSIDTTAARGWTVTPLLVTSQDAGLSTGETMIDPASATFPQTNLAPRLLAVQIAPKSPGDSATRGRVIVVGDAMFASDQFTQHAPDNMAFALNAVDWLAQDEALISIRSKDRSPPVLSFSSPVIRETVKYANVIGLPVLLVIYGFAHLASRRRKTREPYSVATA